MNNGFGTCNINLAKSGYGWLLRAVETTLSTLSDYSKNSASLAAFSDIFLYLISNV